MVLSAEVSAVLSLALLSGDDACVFSDACVLPQPANTAAVSANVNVDAIILFTFILKTPFYTDRSC